MVENHIINNQPSRRQRTQQSTGIHGVLQSNGRKLSDLLIVLHEQLDRKHDLEIYMDSDLALLKQDDPVPPQD
ncbi:MAG: hypothetical protein OXG19_00550 [Chloroflexi bacterium]|nr:hypothetical protein [Chloroflexota bacterium]